MVGHGPADDLAAPGIQHDRQVEEARGRGDEGNVADPKLVRRRGVEVAIHQVRRGADLLVSSRRDRSALTSARPDEASLAHQPGDPLAPVPLVSGR